MLDPILLMDVERLLAAGFTLDDAPSKSSKSRGTDWAPSCVVPDIAPVTMSCAIWFGRLAGSCVGFFVPDTANSTSSGSSTSRRKRRLVLDTSAAPAKETAPTVGMVLFKLRIDSLSHPSGRFLASSSPSASPLLKNARLANSCRTCSENWTMRKLRMS